MPPGSGAHIVVQGGKPVGGVKDITVNKGQPVRFSVTSDVADEIHIIQPQGPTLLGRRALDRPMSILTMYP